MDRVCVAGTGGCDDCLDVEQVERAFAVGPRDDSPDAEPVAGPHDPVGDLAAVGDEDRPDGLERAPSRWFASRQTRQSRHLRHAIAHRRV